MLDKEQYFNITDYSRKKGLKCFSVTNGTRIRTVVTAMKMLIYGPTEITISVDSHIEAKHDELRGVKGSYSAAVGALKLLLSEREKMEITTPVYAMAIISEHNYRTLDQFYAMALNEWGVDKLKLNILQPTFGHVVPDQFYASNLVKDVGALEKKLLECDKKFELGLDPEWIRQVVMYHLSVHENKAALRGWAAKKCTSEVICNTWERNIMVDLYGNAKLCFSPAFPSVKLKGNGAISRFWKEAHWRDDMMKCTRPCGISHSVRRTSATLRHKPIPVYSEHAG